MENLPQAPEGYKYKIKLVKIGLSEAQKRAMKNYQQKNKKKINARNKERYANNEEYRTKIQTRMREMKRAKKDVTNPQNPLI
jgi:hypothetical protein